MKRRPLIALTLIALLVSAPGRAATGDWREVSRTKIPLLYYQGITHDEFANRYFTGIHLGLYRTDPSLNETAANYDVIPANVTAAEGYNHVGDLSYHQGKLFLPLECYYFSAGNTCGTGSIGVADAGTLQMEYYVKLDASIPKAMWCEVSPDGQYLWTSSGSDLFAFRMSDITAANAAPGGPRISPAIHLPGLVPPSRITGATFIGNLLFIAGHDDGQQIWSIDLASRTRTLEIQTTFVGESEGLDDDFDLASDPLDGSLHWQIQPYNTKGYPTTGVTNGMLLNYDRNL